MIWLRYYVSAQNTHIDWRKFESFVVRGNGQLQGREI